MEQLTFLERARQEIGTIEASVANLAAIHEVGHPLKAADSP